MVDTLASELKIKNTTSKAKGEAAKVENHALYFDFKVILSLLLKYSVITFYRLKTST